MSGLVREVDIEGGTLYLADCLDVMPQLGAFDHIFSDPLYEAILHKAKALTESCTTVAAVS